jgi:hypothetical protein
MNSNICHRCRVKPSIFICKECQSSLCSKCDNFVHSSLKRSHKRDKIALMNSASSDKNTNYETNLNFYTNQLINNTENNYENMTDNYNYMNNNNKSFITPNRLLYSNSRCYSTNNNFNDDTKSNNIYI